MNGGGGAGGLMKNKNNHPCLTVATVSSSKVTVLLKLFKIFEKKLLKIMERDRHLKISDPLDKPVIAMTISDKCIQWHLNESVSKSYVCMGHHFFETHWEYQGGETPPKSSFVVNVNFSLIISVLSRIGKNMDECKLVFRPDSLKCRVIQNNQEHTSNTVIESIRHNGPDIRYSNMKPEFLQVVMMDSNVFDKDVHHFLDIGSKIASISICSADDTAAAAAATTASGHFVNIEAISVGGGGGGNEDVVAANCTYRAHQLEEAQKVRYAQCYAKLYLLKDFTKQKLSRFIRVYIPIVSEKTPESYPFALEYKLLPDPSCHQWDSCYRIYIARAKKDDFSGGKRRCFN